MGKHKAALQYVHHALYLTRLVGGKNHPDSATVYVIRNVTYNIYIYF